MAGQQIGWSLRRRQQRGTGLELPERLTDSARDRYLECDAVLHLADDAGRLRAARFYSEQYLYNPGDEPDGLW